MDELKDGVGIVLGYTVMEVEQGTEHTTLKAPVLRVRVEEMLRAILTEIRKPRSQLQMEASWPRFRDLRMSLFDIQFLKAVIVNEYHPDTGRLYCHYIRAECSAREMAFPIQLLFLYAILNDLECPEDQRYCGPLPTFQSTPL